MKAPLTQSQSWLASLELHGFVVTCEPEAPALSVEARQLPVAFTFTLPEVGSTLHCCEFEPRHQYKAAESNGPPESMHRPDLMGPTTLMFL